MAVNGIKFSVIWQMLPALSLSLSRSLHTHQKLFHNSFQIRRGENALRKVCCCSFAERVEGNCLKYLINMQWMGINVSHTKAVKWTVISKKNGMKNRVKNFPLKGVGNLGGCRKLIRINFYRNFNINNNFNFPFQVCTLAHTKHGIIVHYERVLAS